MDLLPVQFILYNQYIVQGSGFLKLHKTHAYHLNADTIQVTQGRVLTQEYRTTLQTSKGIYM